MENKVFVFKYNTDLIKAQFTTQQINVYTTNDPWINHMSLSRFCHLKSFVGLSPGPF